MSEFRISDLSYNDLVQLSLDDISRIIDELMQADAEVGQILQDVRSRGAEILANKSEIYRVIMSALSYIEDHYDKTVRKLFIFWGVSGVGSVFDNSFRNHLSRLKAATEKNESGVQEEKATQDSGSTITSSTSSSNSSNSNSNSNKQDIDAEIDDILKYIKYELRSPHEMNIRTLQNYFDENRMDWWSEPNIVAQIVSDAGKMLHDFALIFSHIHDELEQQVHPAEKSIAHEIVEWLQSKSKYTDYVYFFAIKDFINVQARTSHSVKIDLKNKRVYGHFGDFSPVMDIEAQFHVNNTDELYEFTELITSLIYYEQKIRILLSYLYTNMDVLHEKQVREKVEDIKLYWRAAKRAVRKLKEKYINDNEIQVNYEEWQQSLSRTSFEPVIVRLQRRNML